MYNENEKRNVTVSQKGNAIQSAALNIHQLFPSRTKDECLIELKKNPSVYRTYLNWPDKWKNRFLEFMEGKKSLPLTSSGKVSILKISTDLTHGYPC